MRSMHCGPVFLTLVLMTGVACAQADLGDQVDQLVGQLEANTRRERLDAEQRLRDLGTQILPLLPPAELVGPGARESLARLRFELERKKARESLLPSLVTLDASQSLSEWLTHLTRETGNRFDPSRLSEAARNAKIPLHHSARVPFWTGIAQLSHAARVEVAQRTADGAIQLLEAAAAEPVLARSVVGAFRATAVSANRRAGLVDDEDLLRVTIQLDAEPRLRPLFLRYAARDVSAAPLHPLSPDATYELLLADGARAAQITADFRWPLAASLSSVDFKGRFHVTLAAASEPVRFSDLAALPDRKPISVARRRGGVTVTLERIETDALDEGLQTVAVHLRIRYDVGGPAFESHQSWLLHNRVYLQRAGAAPFELNGGMETTGQADGSASVRYRFVDVPAGPDALAVVYLAPTLIIETPVDVRFPDLPVSRKTLKP